MNDSFVYSCGVLSQNLSSEYNLKEEKERYERLKNDNIGKEGQSKYNKRKWCKHLGPESVQRCTSKSLKNYEPISGKNWSTYYLSTYKVYVIKKAAVGTKACGSRPQTVWQITAGVPGCGGRDEPPKRTWGRISRDMPARSQVDQPRDGILARCCVLERKEEKRRDVGKTMGIFETG